MALSGLHLILSYQCTLECDHCFVWGSPWQTGTMSLARVRQVLDQAQGLGGVEWIYFEGGEPFLFYPVLVAGARDAASRGFRVGVVTNAYWAIGVADAIEWLAPLAVAIQGLAISCDAFHGGGPSAAFAAAACDAARRLGIPSGTMSIAQPNAPEATGVRGQLPEGESAVMYRGRAVEKLAGQVAGGSWHEFVECPHENLRDPGRVHVDPFGNVEICQGIALGNVFTTPLREIVASFSPDDHAVVGPLLAGGPAALVRRYGLAHLDQYADACHLCDAARRQLRSRFPEQLGPDQMYRVVEADEVATGEASVTAR